MFFKIALPFILFTAALLAGCSRQPGVSPAPDTTSQLDTFSRSSGDIDQDLEEIETVIDSLDVEADFPSFSVDDL